MAWALENSTYMGLVAGGGGAFVGYPCGQAWFSVPSNTTHLRGTLVADDPTSSPGAGLLGLALMSPSNEEFFDSMVEGGDATIEVAIDAPEAGTWKIGVYPAPVSVEQYGTVTVAMDGAGSAPAELEFDFHPNHGDGRCKRPS